MSNFIGQRIGDGYGVFTYGWPPQEKGFAAAEQLFRKAEPQRAIAVAKQELNY